MLSMWLYPALIFLWTNTPQGIGYWGWGRRSYRNISIGTLLLLLVNLSIINHNALMMRRFNTHNLIFGLFILFALIFFGHLSETKIISARLQVADSVCNLSGTVINITDGDTLKVLDKHNKQHKIRLAGIDAPEKRQAFGNLAKTYLSDLVKNKHVCVRWNKRGRYGRIIGTVYVDGKDVNLDLVRQGLAWHYKKYQNQQSAQDRQNFALAETNARRGSLGLWRGEPPIAPWQWRQQQKQTARAKRQARASP